MYVGSPSLITYTQALGLSNAEWFEDGISTSLCAIFREPPHIINCRHATSIIIVMLQLQ